MKNTKRQAFALILLGILALPAAAQKDSVEVRIIGQDGKQIGTAHFSKAESGVRIRLQASGLSPGKHGVHIHGKGACEPPAFKTAGAHYEPQDHNHGFLDVTGPHAGDLPMIEVKADGSATDYQFTTTRVMMSEDSLLDTDGSSLIIHAKPDDYLTDPGGDTGDRIACGVISPPSE